MTSHPNGSMVSEITYDPFLMLICSHDAEWSRQSQADGSCWFAPFEQLMNEFSEACWTYRDNVNTNYRQFCAANGSKAKESLKSPYFDPVFYLPFGHADVLSLTLLDDFDPTHHLMGRTTTALEDISLGFCPSPISLGAQEGEPLFPNISSLWPIFNIQDESQTPPLLLFSKFKMDSLGSLGLALPCQIAIWKAMMTRIRSVVNALRRDFVSDAPRAEVGKVKTDDIDTIRCLFLDLQGSEEIGLLLFSQNLCVAASVLGGLLNLTYGDLFKEMPKLAEQMGKSRVHRQIAAFSRLKNKLETEVGELKVKDVICHNHVLRWTRSSVAVIPGKVVGDTGRLFCEGNRCGGYVRANTKFRVAPGHLTPACEVANATLGKDARHESRFEAPAGPYWEHLIGLYDASFAHLTKGLAHMNDNVVSISDVIDNVETTLKKLCLREAFPDGRTYRDVVDLETELLIPVPTLKDENYEYLIGGHVGKSHSSLLGKILPMVKERLCFFSGMEEVEKEQLSATCKPGGLDIEELREAQRRLGVPLSLRRIIECLYQDYAVLVSDPFTYDLVLDLYDVFVTLHAIIVHHLEEVPLGQFESTSREGRCLLDEGRVSCIAEIAESLHNALIHRTVRVFPDLPNRDMAVDLRGGLNQILLATDVAIKCGLGVLRRFAPPPLLTTPQKRERVGCVMRIVKMPGARCCIAQLGVEHKARLAFFDVDTPHVLHVASHANYLHEAFHLVFRAATSLDKDLREATSGLTQNTVDRLDEIFSLMLWKLLVFGTDTESFFFHSILSYSRDLSSVGINDRETCERFTEVLIRHFFAVYGMEEDSNDPRFWSLDYKTGVLENFKAAEHRFLEVLKTAGPFFSEYRRLWEDDPQKRAQNTSVKHFTLVFQEISDCLPLLRRMALDIYRRAMDALLQSDDLSIVESMMSKIDADFDMGLEQGRPLIWSKYKRPSGVPLPKTLFESDRNLGEGGLDALPFICRMLYKYIQTIRFAVGKEIHLRRGSDQAVVDYKTRTNWYKFQADTGAAALFCPVPSGRSKRLRKQIVIFKSLWDVASELRARRLLDILLSNAIEPVKPNEQREAATP